MGWRKNFEYSESETESKIAEYEMQMHDAVLAYMDEFGIEDLRKESQNVFNGCLRYIYRSVFAPTKDKKPVDTRFKSLIDLNNIALIHGILNYYLYLCDIYSKAVNVSSFSNLTGIDVSIIYDWYNKVNRADNPEYSKIYKILDKERERSLSDLLTSGVKQPVGLLAVLNHEKGWNLPGTTKEIHHVASVENPEKIAERYRSRLADQGEKDGDN